MRPKISPIFKADSVTLAVSRERAEQQRRGPRGHLYRRKCSSIR
jgi:hypothetical protein